MKHVTLRQLRVFAAAARHMNFSHAAAELHMSQPAVSTQLKQVAGVAGLPLFERIGRRMYLTPAGREILQCANAVAQRLKDTESALAQLKGVTGGGSTWPSSVPGTISFRACWRPSAPRTPG